MELKERIALARKQAGLSQEQLGEKLGVSRQAVSKPRRGLSGRDVPAVRRVLRLAAAGQGDRRCLHPRPLPRLSGHCNRTGQFLSQLRVLSESVPKSSVRPGPEICSYLPRGQLDFVPDLREGVYKPAFSLPNQDLLGYTHKILCQAPRALFRGLTLDQARALQSRFAHPGDLLVCFDPTGNAPLPRLMDRPYKPSPQQGLSFWTTVGAVILGVICALLILMIVF